MTDNKKLRELPSVTEVMDHPAVAEVVACHGRGAVTRAAREAIDAARAAVQADQQAPSLDIIAAQARKGDMVIAFSRDGESPACTKALVAAREANLVTAAFLGRDGGTMKNYVDHALVVEAEHPARVHEVHLAAAQILAQLVERKLFPL